MRASVNEIRKECFKHNGKAFDMIDCAYDLKDTWYVKRELLKYKWLTSERDRNWVKVSEYEEKEMKKVPKGITCSKTYEEINALPEPYKGASDVVHKAHVAFTLHVSEKYSTSMLATAEGKRTFFYEYQMIKPEVLKQAREFRDRVLSAHLKVVEDAYEYTFKSNYGGMVYSDGIFTADSDGSIYSGGISFSQYGLKDLSELYQKYGFTMAMTEYGIKDLGSNQWYCITFGGWGGVTISIVGDAEVPTESVSKADW